MKYLALLLFISLCVYTRGDEEDILVDSNVGQIRGLKDESGYNKFLGVPYGLVDEDNIFGAAVPHPNFEEVFEAYNVSEPCAQVGKKGVKGIIDCLKLDIYVPNTANSEQLLPVMVWIHGGAFIGGKASRQTRNSLSLLKHDVIVVGINYRLGVFGFMCLDNPKVPGNTGLKDQVLALRWINNNIEAFGGDPNQITAFGESAGGMSVNLHLFSSYEKLFNKAIIESGPANSYWTIVESDSTIPIKLAKSLGLKTTDVNEALSFLSHKDPLLIAQAAHDLKISNAQNVNQPLTKPCIEQKFEGVENFLTEHPMNMRSIKARTTPVIIGNNNNEYAFQLAEINATFFDSYDFSDHFALGFDMIRPLVEGLENVKHFYIGDEDISDKVRSTIIDFGSDFIFNHPTQRMTQILVESGAKNVYRYIFSYSGSTNKTWSGATHGEELKYLFNNGDDETEQDKLVTDRLAELWTNFAKYGDPTPETTELLSVKWTPVTKTTQPYLEIDSDLTLKNRPFHRRMAFWDIFYEEYGHFQKWSHHGGHKRGKHHFHPRRHMRH